MHTSNQEFSNSQENRENLNTQSGKDTNVNLVESDFIINEIPPNSTTITVIKTLPPTPNKSVNPKASPFDKSFYDISNLEKIWNMPMLNPTNRRPTLKFWITLVFLICLILFAGNNNISNMILEFNNENVELIIFYISIVAIGELISSSNDSVQTHSSCTKMSCSQMEIVANHIHE
ncbi:2012_t:CDS:2 [Gigaspora margarita]|uniref:2012_t:CDS:1 n=1 Tax=Gigaspora margarita TaxID=4874 RepID=A0ABN7V0W2_GIGMA|nr:2012_t:CDS:2 [Gigaspora margarita]